MTTKANILLQAYVDAVHDYRQVLRGGSDDLTDEEEKMDAAELELTTYISELEQKAGTA